MASASFLKPISDPKSVAILLVDASGSVRGDFDDKQSVFKKMEQVVTSLPHERFFLLFWCSAKISTAGFSKGTRTIPYVVTKTQFSTYWDAVAKDIHRQMLTEPHVAFDALPTEWLKHTRDVYLITDGVLYGDHTVKELQELLAASLCSFHKQWPDHNIAILSVETTDMDYGQAETTDQFAGNDVFQILRAQQLTNVVTSFVSYNLRHPDGFVQLRRHRTAPGFATFRESKFSLLHRDKFLVHYHDLVYKAKEDSKALLELAHDVGPTLNQITAEMAPKVKEQVIRLYSGLFKSTCIDPQAVEWILGSVMQDENKNQAQILGAYMAQLKQLYATTDKALHQNVKQAIGVRDGFMTFPLPGLAHIVTGPACKALVAWDQTWPDAALEVENKEKEKIAIPVLPFPLRRIRSESQEVSPTHQAIRQWCRAVVAKTFQTPASSENTLMACLALNLAVALSAETLPAAVVTSFQELALIMLEKKRNKTELTELEALRQGQLPSAAGGTVLALHRVLTWLLSALKWNWKDEEKATCVGWSRFWLALCAATGDKALIRAQSRHCEGEIAAKECEWATENPSEYLEHIKPQLIRHDWCNWTPLEFQLEELLDYECLVTLEDTSKNGGWRFYEHKDPTGANCFPRYVLSTQGRDQLVAASETKGMFCPICHSPLESARLVKVEQAPPPHDWASLFTSPTSALCWHSAKPSSAEVDTVEPEEKKKSSSQKRSQSYESDHLDSLPTDRGCFILLRGALATGKSTWASKKAKELRAQGHPVYVEGTDKYVNMGLQGKAVRKMVTQQLQKAQKEQKERKAKKESCVVVILDTCGEQTDTKQVFGVNFSTWDVRTVWPNLHQERLKQYLAWSLVNLLNRTEDKGTAEVPIVLSPTTATLTVCIRVWTQKVKSLFGESAPIPFETVHSAEALVQQSAPAAAEYLAFLKERQS